MTKTNARPVPLVAHVQSLYQNDERFVQADILLDHCQPTRFRFNVETKAMQWARHDVLPNLRNSSPWLTMPVKISWLTHQGIELDVPLATPVKESEPLTTETDQTTMADALKKGWQLKIDHSVHIFNLTPLLEERANVEAALKHVSQLIQETNEQEASLQKYLNGNVSRFLIALGIYLPVQFLSVIVLTYSIGWDIMEPTVYMIGAILSSVLYASFMLTRKDESLGTLLALLKKQWESRFYQRKLLGEIKGEQPTLRRVWSSENHAVVPREVLLAERDLLEKQMKRLAWLSS